MAESCVFAVSRFLVNRNRLRQVQGHVLPGLRPAGRLMEQFSAVLDPELRSRDDWQINQVRRLVLAPSFLCHGRVLIHENYQDLPDERRS
jgi:hypothetical protein